jgi:hypothetical protein
VSAQPARSKTAPPFLNELRKNILDELQEPEVVQLALFTTENVVAVWRAVDRAPGLRVTARPATLRRCTAARHRTGAEDRCRAVTSCGWQGQRSRLRRPARGARLLLGRALATLGSAALAQRVRQRGGRPLRAERRRRCDSTFQLGLRGLTRLLSTEQHVPCLLHWGAEQAAPLKLS